MQILYALKNVKITFNRSMSNLHTLDKLHSISQKKIRLAYKGCQIHMQPKNFRVNRAKQYYFTETFTVK